MKNDFLHLKISKCVKLNMVHILIRRGMYVRMYVCMDGWMDGWMDVLTIEKS